jgi:hypothetical protein
MPTSLAEAYDKISALLAVVILAVLMVDALTRLSRLLFGLLFGLLAVRRLLSVRPALP